MSMSEIMWIQGAFGFAVALFEFPTGYLGDRIGYRKMLLYGSLLSVVGWSVYSVASSLVSVLIAELVLGVALSMVSGSDSALMFESVAQSGEAGCYRRWDGRARFFGQLAEGLAALVSGAMFVWWFRLPFVIEALVWLYAAWVAFRLVEPQRHKTIASGTHFQRTGALIRYAFVQNPQLAVVILMMIVLGLAGYVPVWLIPLYAEDAGVPVAWIGPIWAVANFFVAGAALAADRVGRRLGLIPALAACIALIGIGYLGLGWSVAIYGFGYYFLITIARGTLGPLLQHEQQLLIPSQDRAAILSLRSLVFRLSFLCLGPIVGAFVDTSGSHAVFLGLAAMFVTLSTGLLMWMRCYSWGRI